MGGNWRKNLRTCIRGVDIVLVMWGEYTGTAASESVEISITQDEKCLQLLLWGRGGRERKKPASENASDDVYD